MEVFTGEEAIIDLENEAFDFLYPFLGYIFFELIYVR